LGELAFPVTATLVGIYVFNSTLRWTQWLGVAATILVVSLLPARRRDIVRAPDLVPAPAAS
jgi:drug/metabolite transporter (DMT)-like permease